MANENTRKVEEERDIAREQARVANERTQHTEELQKQAEDARDVAIKDRDTAREQTQRAEELQKQAEQERDVAREKNQVFKATQRAIKRKKKCIAPENRKGARGKYKHHPIVKFAPRAPKPEIVCQDKNHEWALGIELSDDFLNSNAEPQVYQDDSPLEQMSDLWLLGKLQGAIKVHSAEKSWTTVLDDRENGYFIFKLNGYDLRHGTRVSAIYKGAYLVVVPEDWDRVDENIGSAPEAVSIDGYLAHYYVIDQITKIAFRTPDGKRIEIAQSTLQFDLIGNCLPDADEENGLLFGATLPLIRAANLDTWHKVKTIVVGEEGRERKNWQTIKLTPNKTELKMDLPPEIAQWQASWFFV
ncbi:MAG: hypothetical protein HZC40_16370 [Chloroflexi bacterium]|nr:hypothetical protein [Chloroflexota bacterium]